MPYISGTEQIKLKLTVEKIIADSKLIKGIIKTWESSPEYQAMITGENYYKGEHDILKKNFTKVSIWNSELGDFEIKDNPNACNVKVENPFHFELNLQKTNYVAGKRIQFKVKDSKSKPEAVKLENDINNELNDYFESTAQDWVLGAGNKGYEVLMPFIDENGAFNYMISPAQNVIPDYDESTGRLLSVMRLLFVDKINDKNELKKIRAVEIWNDSKVLNYIQENEEGEFIFEVEQSHYDLENTALGQVNPGSWGRPPFIFLYNNSFKLNDLKRVKNSIDAYDAVKTGFFHDVDTIQSVIYHVNDYTGTDLKEIPAMLKLLKVVATQGEDGKFDAIQIDIPYEAKEKILGIIKKDIYRFGQGVDMAEVEKLGDVPIVAINTLFFGLDLKANQTISQLKLALKDFIWFLIYYLENKKNPGKVIPANIQKLADSVSAVITKSTITNDSELINQILTSVTGGVMSKAEAMRKHPLIDDPEQNKAELEEEQQVNLDMVPSDTPADGVTA